MKVLKKIFKKGTAILSVCTMLAGMITVLPGTSAGVRADEDNSTPLSVTAYAEKNELMTAFSPDEDGNAEYIGKLLFGKNVNGAAQEWYLLGSDSSINGDNMVLFAAGSMDARQTMFSGVDTENTFDVSFGLYENNPEKVYANHYGASDLRKAMNCMAASTDYFSAAEQSLMNVTTVTTEDTRNNLTYTTTDRLYALKGDFDDDQRLWAGSRDTIILPLKIYWNSGEWFWLRSPYQDLYEEELTAYPGSFTAKSYVGSNNAVRPALNLDLSSVIFASAATASSGTIASDKAMNLRLDGSHKNIGNVTYSILSGDIKAQKGSISGNVTLIVQGRGVINGSEQDWCYSKTLDATDTVTVRCSDIRTQIGLSSEMDLSACRIWLETTEDNVIYAINAQERFKLLDITEPQPLTMANGAQKSDIALALPQHVLIKTENSEVTTAAVTWDVENVTDGSYNPAVLEEQTFTIKGKVTLPEHVVADGMSLETSISVTVSAADKVAVPKVYPDAGTYTDNQSVGITCSTAGAEIYYTTDGTVPSLKNGNPSGSTMKYTDAIAVTGTQGKDVVTTIKAIAVKAGMFDSEVAEFIYIIGIPHIHGFENAAWKMDSNFHWHECNVTNCNRSEGYIADYAAHEFAYAYTWTTDYKKCTAVRKCGVCGYTDSETVDTSGTVTQNQTCTLPELTTYVAVFENAVDNGFTDQTKTDIQTAEPLGHHLSAWISNENDTHSRKCQNEGCTYVETEACGGGAASYFQCAECKICGGIYGSLTADTTAPTGEITVSTNRWNTFLNKITFGYFFCETQDVIINGTDDSYAAEGYDASKHAVKLSYLLVNGGEANICTQDELAEKYRAGEFKAYKEPFHINPDDNYVIYAGIEDYAGNITFISTDGIVIDTEAPVINGIEDGKTYCGTAAFTVFDVNLDEVTDTIIRTTEESDVLQNESAQNTIPITAQDGKYMLSAGIHTITATDQAGNRTSITVTVNKEHMFGAINYIWQSDNSACTAEAECTVCHTKAAETAAASVTVTQNRTCTLPELTTYVAVFQSTNGFAEQTKADIRTAEPPGHIYGDWIVDRPATIEETGSQHKACIVCGEILETSEIAKLVPPSYEITAGAESKWILGMDGTVVIRGNGDLSKFIGVKADGILIDKTNYIAEEGSTIVTLKSDYLNALSEGSHTFELVWTDGAAGTDIIVYKNTSNDGGDTDKDNGNSGDGNADKDNSNANDGSADKDNSNLNDSSADKDNNNPNDGSADKDNSNPNDGKTDKDINNPNSGNADKSNDNAGVGNVVDDSKVRNLPVMSEDNRQNPTVGNPNQIPAPSTGDNGHVFLWFILLITSVIGIKMVHNSKKSEV